MLYILLRILFQTQSIVETHMVECMFVVHENTKDLVHR